MKLRVVKPYKGRWTTFKVGQVLTTKVHEMHSFFHIWEVWTNHNTFDWIHDTAVKVLENDTDS